MTYLGTDVDCENEQFGVARAYPGLHKICLLIYHGSSLGWLHGSRLFRKVLPVQAPKMNVYCFKSRNCRKIGLNSMQLTKSNPLPETLFWLLLCWHFTLNNNVNFP